MSNEHSRWRRAGLATLAVLSLSAGTAAAQSCVGEIDRLARQFDLPPDARQSGTTEAPAAPSTPPSGGAGATATESRAQSSGVLSPPDTAAPTAIRPPSSTGDRPASPPDVTTTASGAGGELPAVERQRMARLVQQAQAAARQGNEQQCLDRLRDAQAVPGIPDAK
jgi:hypothetical protein